MYNKVYFFCPFRERAHIFKEGYIPRVEERKMLMMILCILLMQCWEKWPKKIENNFQWQILNEYVCMSYTEHLTINFIKQSHSKLYTSHKSLRPALILNELA